MIDRLNRSWVLVKESFAVLKGNPALAIFPVLSGIATIVASTPFIIVLALAAMNMNTQKESSFDPVYYAVMAAMYFVNYFIVVFFNAGLVACANENLQGRPTTLRFGFNAAMKRLPQILGWALIASTVGMILKFIGERTGVIGSIVTSLVGLVWNLAVFFVVPVLIIEKESPVQAIKTSTGMIKQTWGERVIMGLGVGTAIGLVGLLALIPFAIAVALAVANQLILAAIMGLVTIVFLLIVGVVGSAITTIYTTALFQYCRTGQTPTAFSPGSLQGAFRAKPESKFFGSKF